MTIQQVSTQLAGGMRTSIQIFLVILIFPLPLGLLVIFGRISKNQLLQAIVKVYISIIRGTPLMLQPMVVCFGLYCLFRIKVDSGHRLRAAFIGFVTNHAAYFAKIYRSGTQSIPVGRYEATQTLGYSRSQTFFRVMLPQVTRRVLPSVTDEIIILIRDTFLTSALSVTKMFSIVKALAVPQIDMIPFVAAGLFYCVFNPIVAVGTEWVEKRMDYYRQEQEDRGLWSCWN